MKLWIWEGDGVLEVYRTGLVFAVAETEERARELVCEDHEPAWEAISQIEPKVYEIDAEIVRVMWGSE